MLRRLKSKGFWGSLKVKKRGLSERVESVVGRQLARVIVRPEIVSKRSCSPRSLGAQPGLTRCFIWLGVVGGSGSLRRGFREEMLLAGVDWFCSWWVGVDG